MEIEIGSYYMSKVTGNIYKLVEIVEDSYHRCRVVYNNTKTSYFKIDRYVYLFLNESLFRKVKLTKNHIRALKL